MIFSGAKAAQETHDSYNPLCFDPVSLLRNFMKSSTRLGFPIRSQY